MSFGPADFAGFGGLNLAADAEDSPGALDLSNVTLSQPGPSRLLPRPGYTLAGTTDLSTVDGFAGAGASYAAGDSAGVLRLGSVDSWITNTGGTPVGPWGIVSMGVPEDSVPTFTNGTFVASNANWTAGSSTITRDTGTFDTTPASGRWDNTGASDVLASGDYLAGAFTGTFVPGVMYRCTFRLWSSIATPNLTIFFGRTSTDGGTSAAAATLAATTWTTVTVDWMPNSIHDTSNVALLLTAGASVGYFRIDSCAITQTPVAAFGAQGEGIYAVGTLYGAEALGAVQATGSSSYTIAPTSPAPYTLAVQPKDNRLVAAGFQSYSRGPNITESGPSHVYFSEPDAPTMWKEDNYIILSGGDGESIRAATAWNDYLLVFKQSKFFVFYGNSVDSTGGTVFNYRTVGNAFGGSSSAIYQGQVCSAPSGVYVITDTGVWKTTGSAPVLVSPGLSPLFNQNVSTLAYQGTGYTKLAPRSATGSGGSFWHQGKVYFSVTITRSTATTSSGWLILDEQSGQWTVWELADTPRVGASVSGGIVFPSGLSTTGRKGLLSMDGTATTDNGTAIASYYTSPYLTYGEPKAEKHVRASELHGTGTVTLAWGKDLQTHGTAETVAMSSGIGHARTGARGRVLSFKIAASAAGWTVNRVVPLLQAVRTGK